eukprot:scaffold20041_cov60-Cyclotella_meneghiniana.AAC.1
MPNDSVPAPASCEEGDRLIIEEYVMSEFLVMFGMDTKQSAIEVGFSRSHQQTNRSKLTKK